MTLGYFKNIQLPQFKRVLDKKLLISLSVLSQSSKDLFVWFVIFVLLSFQIADFKRETSKGNRVTFIRPSETSSIWNACILKSTRRRALVAESFQSSSNPLRKSFRRIFPQLSSFPTYGPRNKFSKFSKRHSPPAFFPRTRENYRKFAASPSVRIIPYGKNEFLVESPVRGSASVEFRAGSRRYKYPA